MDDRRPDPIAVLTSLPLQPAYAALGEPYVTPVPTTPLPTPQLLHVNPALAAELGIDNATLASNEFVDIMAGNRVWPGYAPLSSVYGGHQFGVWVPRLGDGRAHLIAEIATAAGQRRELQLKGSGPTPYSRFADGRAVLRSSIREYLCSEAMHALGIPTTRALALVGSPQPVRRETIETAAVVCRVAPSLVRFGHFEYFYYRNEHAQLAPLADHVINENFPEFAHAEHRHAAWLGEVIARTARLMAAWQAVGFCHGVMNTDNFSVLGLTLDYGPYGFIDAFDAHHICNHTDEGGRYAYDQQPTIGHWNCSRLLQATLPLLSDTPERAVELATEILDRYPAIYAQAMTRAWRGKLGLRESRAEDRELINRYLSILDRGHSDLTRSFRNLAQVRGNDAGPTLGVREEIADLERFDAWIDDYRARLRGEQSDDAERSARMNAVNPKYVLRNHLAQAAIEAAQGGDYSEIARLFTLLQKPFDEQPEYAVYAAEPPASARHIEVSCSS
ncbi:MAG: YdiU family protein [Nevskia sp.]|nr:YdiU family protein [Nevskia sp.]